MDTGSLELQIIEAFEDPNNFLIQLGVKGEFNEILYRNILSLLHSYVEALENNPKVNRQIARFVYDFVTILEGQVYQFEIRQHRDLIKVQNAHAEVLNLLYELLP